MAHRVSTRHVDIPPQFAFSATMSYRARMCPHGRGHLFCQLKRRRGERYWEQSGTVRSNMKHKCNGLNTLRTLWEMFGVIWNVTAADLVTLWTASDVFIVI